MAETLTDVGEHTGYWGVGHYEATVRADGDVIIKTILDNARQRYTVHLFRAQWDRLVAWVNWQRANQASLKMVLPQVHPLPLGEGEGEGISGGEGH